MEIPITTPALLFPAIAILMLGYINKYLAIGNVIRTFKKDYDSGYTHVDVVNQLTILAKRMELSRQMLTAGMIALLFACASMFSIFIGSQQAGKIAFGLALVGMITSMLLSLYEISLSTKSLMIEINDVYSKEAGATPKVQPKRSHQIS